MKRQWLGWKYGFVIIGLVILALLVMDFNNRMADLRRLEGKEQDVAVEATQMMETQQNLQTQIAFATSDAGVYQWAYEEGHWVRQGDTLVVPLVVPGATSVPTIQPTPTPQAQRTWEVWLSLFSDKYSIQGSNAP